LRLHIRIAVTAAAIALASLPSRLHPPPASPIGGEAVLAAREWLTEAFSVGRCATPC
jgi:hypothetical protein